MVEKKPGKRNKAKTAKPPKLPTPTPTPDSPAISRQPGFVVVGVGASAGGLEALSDLLDHLPADTGMAFVVVTHQHPDHISLLPELLARESKMQVVEALEGVTLQPDHVYVGTPGAYLAIRNGIFHRFKTEDKKSPTLPIDTFFRSLAEDKQEQAVCIVLSGTGSDGSLGLKAIKAASGMVMVQQPQSALYAGMPASAIATGLADYVLPPAAMPQQLIAYAQGSFVTATAVAAESPAIAAEPMQRIFMLLQQGTGHDFSGYKSSTLRRRIERRMNVHQIEDPAQYARYLQEHPPEVDVLFKELLISVTNFFRDPQAWDALQPYLEELLNAHPDGQVVRAWVPGCATGEEAYSLGIALRECMDKMNRYLHVEIFATDLDADAIGTARAGHYPDGITADVSRQRLERHFVHDNNGYRICKVIRDMVIFAQQNVIKDPPFTRVDIIICRNMLIYLNSDLQKKLIPLFHYALNPDGLLFLGLSETVGSLSELFVARDKQWKIFQRRANSEIIQLMPPFPAQSVVHHEVDIRSLAMSPAANEAKSLKTLVEQVLLKRLVPACVVVNHQGDIFYIYGRTGEYLEPAQGKPRNNILDMARDGLQIELATALRECATRHDNISRENILLKTDGTAVHVDLAVMRINEPPTIADLLLVTFRHRPVVVKQNKEAKAATEAATEKPSLFATNTSDKLRVEQLERELYYLRETYQTTLEQLKTSNEELQASNEELQSTNEELESSREEMQSLNEELTTVNAELESKFDELSFANDDMQNLLNSIDIATIFLDAELNIKRFTDQAQGLVMLRPADVGRPICELASNLKIKDLAADCRGVLKTLLPREREVETVDGTTYLMRILPYRTFDNVIDGLVISFVDISRLKSLEAAREYLQNILDTLREPLTVLDEDLRIITANEAFYRCFNTRPSQVEGQLIYEVAAGRWDINKLRSLLEEILPKHTLLVDYELNIRLHAQGPSTFLLNARRLEQNTDLPGRLLLAFEDVTYKHQITRD